MLTSQEVSQRSESWLLHSLLQGKGWYWKELRRGLI